VTLDQWQDLVHGLAKEKGWWDGKPNLAEKIALVHSELSEALEFVRLKDFDPGAITYNPDGKPEGFAVELADAVIRIMDLAEYLGVPLDDMIELKHEYNKSRPYKHGKAL
jgi:NTP pyrophosphatase (non-canonical NTP hydrolase)